MFIPFLEKNGFSVDVQTPRRRTTMRRLLATDLVLQCYTQGVATDEQVTNLCAAVVAGTGLAGWHGGIVDSFRAARTTST